MKTTTAINLAGGLGYVGIKVLLMVCDTQGKATKGVGSNTKEGALNVYELIMEVYRARVVLRKLSTPPVYIIPANIS